MQELIGQDLGRYHIIERLGEGGMATVFKAFDTRLEREVAVKVIRREAFSPEVVDRMLQRFEREAKALSKLIHANIVPIIDYGDEGGSPYLVMPLIDGGTLKDKLASQVFSASEAARILAPIARALDYAHSRGILHRDVKPSNILITNSGDPMLSDFGVAKILEEGEAATLTGTGIGLGTPEYMAPEQWVGKATAASDQYSLGVVFYEMITGHKPYTAETPAAVLLKQANEPLPRPKMYVQNLPDEVERILFKALAKRPEDRYPTILELGHALEGVAFGKNTGRAPIKEKRNMKVQNPDANATMDALVQENGSHTTPENIFKKISRPAVLWTVILCAVGLIAVGIIGAVSGWFAPQGAPATEPTVNGVTDPQQIIVNEMDGMKMVFVPKGEFLMGSLNEEGNADEQPQRLVSVDDFWIDQTEVTNAMYEKCFKSGVCSLPADVRFSEASYSVHGNYFSNSEFDDFPVVNVTWSQAKTYCTWAGQTLPTEAQWEKAARGTEGIKYPWGNDWASQYITNYDNNSGITVKVDSYPGGASPYGALNMAGNAWEWVSDWYDETYYSDQINENPTGPEDGTFKVMRGGSWINSAPGIRTAQRGRELPESFNNTIGFRCVKNTD